MGPSQPNPSTQQSNHSQPRPNNPATHRGNGSRVSHRVLCRDCRCAGLERDQDRHIERLADLEELTPVAAVARRQRQAHDPPHTRPIHTPQEGPLGRVAGWELQVHAHRQQQKSAHHRRATCRTHPASPVLQIRAGKKKAGTLAPLTSKMTLFSSPIPSLLTASSFVPLRAGEKKLGPRFLSTPRGTVTIAALAE